MFALVDCNNFYASCERLFRPDLIGKPICVLSNNDGCVIARSNEAKAIGIPMGAPAFEWQKVFNQSNVIVFSANFSLYGDISHRVMNVLSNFSPELEVYSIDEIFLGLNGYDYFDLVEYGTKMRSMVKQWTGIPVTVGFAPTKSLAKVANRIAKKYPQFNNVYSMDSEYKRLKALKWLPIGDVWGIGSQHSKRLNSIGIKTAYDFTQMDEMWIRSNMGIVGIRLRRDLEGKPTLALDDVQNKKSIATTRSFDQNYTTIEQLRERISSFTIACAEKMRKQKSECNSLMLFIETNGFRTNLPQYCPNIVLQLPYPTNSSMDLVRFANLGLDSIFKDGYLYKRAGVVVQNFTPESDRQLNLFYEGNPKHKALMRSIDKTNNILGQQKVKFACQDLKKIWKMKQELLSPRYTTRFSDIITIKV